MNPLEPPDSLYLRAAEGWLELGNHQEANAELEKIQPQLRAHPHVLLVRWQVHAMARNWDACLEIATAITKLAPDLAQGWVSLGNTLYWAGRTQEAYDRMKAVLDRFPTDPVLRYNLGCYACRLGDMEGASRWLDKALALGGGQNLKLMALNDPDLEPLWKQKGRQQEEAG